MHRTSYYYCGLFNPKLLLEKKPDMFSGKLHCFFRLLKRKKNKHSNRTLRNSSMDASLDLRLKWPLYLITPFSDVKLNYHSNGIHTDSIYRICGINAWTFRDG